MEVWQYKNTQQVAPCPLDKVDLWPLTEGLGFGLGVVFVGVGVWFDWGRRSGLGWIGFEDSVGVSALFVLSFVTVLTELPLKHRLPVSALFFFLKVFLKSSDFLPILRTEHFLHTAVNWRLLSQL